MRHPTDKGTCPLRGCLFTNTRESERADGKRNVSRFNIHNLNKKQPIAIIMSPIEIIFIAFAVFAWSRAILRLRDREISVWEFMLWTLIWISVIVVTVFQDVLVAVSEIVGISRGTDLAVYVSIVALFYLLFRLYVRVDKQNQEMTRLVREIAIQNPKKRKK